ncbi:energy transducer TonB [Methylocella sp.]|uniref:energy transducer TonB n=1 Tax=Methylocella sp. TaxID=1978226 RepID=UPI003784F69B
MTMQAEFILPPRETPPVGRWAAAALVVLLLHGVFAWWLMHRPEDEQALSAPEGAVLLDLPPLAPGQVDGGGAPAPQTEQETQPDAEPEPEAVPEPPPEPTPEAEPVPDILPAPRAEAVLVKPEKPTPKPKKIEKVEPKRKRVEHKPAPRRVSHARPPSGTGPGRAGGVAGQGGGGGGGGGAGGVSMSGSNWRGLVYARLNAAKRTFGGAGGLATVSFSVDRSGRLIAAHLVRSSGSPLHDQEAVALVRRAAPFPPPPSEIGGSVITLTVPINFR